MVWLCQSKTGLDNLDQALDHIVAVTWESAAVPSVFQIVAVSLYDSKSGESHHLVLFFSLMTGKLYTLGILRSLNSRPDLRGRMTSDDVGRRSLSEVRMHLCRHPEVCVFWGVLTRNFLTDVVPIAGVVASIYAAWPKAVRLARK